MLALSTFILLKFYKDFVLDIFFSSRAFYIEGNIGVDIELSVPFSCVILDIIIKLYVSGRV